MSIQSVSVFFLNCLRVFPQTERLTVATLLNRVGVFVMAIIVSTGTVFITSKAVWAYQGPDPKCETSNYHGLDPLNGAIVEVYGVPTLVGALIQVREGNNDCDSRTARTFGPYLNASPLTTFVIGNNNVPGGPLQLRWTTTGSAGGARHFRVDGVPVADQTDFLIPLTANHQHVIEYTLTDSGPDRNHRISFEMDAAERLFVSDNIKPVSIANSAPTITTSATLNTPENKSGTILDIEASDSFDIDGVDQGLSYSFSTDGGGGSDNNLFNLFAPRGLLSFATSPNFEAPHDGNGDGIYEVQVKVRDSLGLTDTLNLTVTVTDVADEVRPTVAITGMPTFTSSAAPYVVTFTFSEPVSDFTVFDLDGANFTLTSTSDLLPASGPASVYTLEIIPTDGGDVELAVMANSVVDASGNKNVASPTVTSILDTGTPGVTVLNVPTQHDGSTPFNVTVEFSEDVANFIADDINVGNGGVSNFVSVDGNTYTVEITPTSRNDITIDIAAGVANDIAGNLNLALEQVTISGTVIEDTQKIIGAFMEHRATAIANSQPNIGVFINGNRTGYFSANGDRNNLALNYAGSLNLNAASQLIVDRFGGDENSGRKGTMKLWTQFSGVNSSAGTGDSEIWIGYFGGHKFLSDDFLIGGLVQVDYSKETDKVAASSVDGTGWMIGPYVAGRVIGQDVFYEARIAWGRSENKITPFGTYTDKFETERWVASGKLSGNYLWGDDVTFSPNIALFYSDETQKTYTDSLTNVIPSQTISGGNVNFGPVISKKITLGEGATLTTKAGVSGIYTINASTTNTPLALTINQGDLRAKLDFGLELLTLNGMSIQSTLFYDGIGIEDYSAYGGSIKFIIPIK